MDVPPPKKVFEFRLVGGQISPLTLDIGELADLLRAVRDSLAALALGDGELEMPFVLGLQEIRMGSVVVALASPTPKQVMPAVSRFNGAIRTADLTGVPDVMIEGAKRIQSIAKRYSVKAEFFSATATKRPSAVITATTEFRVPAVVYGETTLFGKVERTGGATAPRVLLRIAERHALLPCDADESIVRQLGARMYEPVAVFGDATWNAKDHEIRSFRIRRVEPFRHGNTLSQAFDELREAVGPSWDQLPDVEAFAASLREDGDA